MSAASSGWGCDAMSGHLRREGAAGSVRIVPKLAEAQSDCQERSPDRTNIGASDCGSDIVSGMAMRATTVRFGDDLWTMLEREAGRHGVSAAQFVRDATILRIAYLAGERG